MEKTKQSYHIDADLESAIEILGVRTNLNGADLICKILRKDPELAQILEQQYSPSDISDSGKKAKIPTQNEIDTTLKNEMAFENFLKSNIDNPKYRDRYVAFINGRLEGSGDLKVPLILDMYKKFGNVEMYVSKVMDKEELAVLSTPEFH